jgi:hypothetical protein
MPVFHLHAQLGINPRQAIVVGIPVSLSRVIFTAQIDFLSLADLRLSAFRRTAVTVGRV